MSIAVVGAGFSGTLLALHLLRACPPGTRITLIERNNRFGRGLAFATGNPSHLLNVPAGRMSAFHDRPGHFLDWLRAEAPDAEHGPLCFVPRQLFGVYVRSLLNEELGRDDSALELVRGDVIGIDADRDGVGLALDRERFTAADRAVLAIGNFPPEAPRVADPAFYDGPLYRPDPWAPDALTGLDPDAPALLIGTGLTMVDTALSLLDQGHRGPIHALSRRGLLPRRHAPGGPAARAEARTLPPGLGALLRLVRADAREAAAAGRPWQAVIDELRPYTVSLWQGMTDAERRRFLRHLRPWWDVHRHRLSAGVADRIDAARAGGQLAIHAGRVVSFTPAPGGVEVAYRPRRACEIERLAAQRVVNCSGPNCDYGRIAEPLIRTLLGRGLARPDALQLGLDVTPDCALRDAEGRASDRLFAVGPVTRGTFWEITSVPDIRRQCEALAAHLAALPLPSRRPLEQARG